MEILAGAVLIAVIGSTLAAAIKRIRQIRF